MSIAPTGPPVQVTIRVPGHQGTTAPARQPVRVSRAPGVTPPASEAWLKTNALSGVLVLAAVVCAGVAWWLLVRLDGWNYYAAPVASRGYLLQHAVLRPSGTVGLSLGVAGAAAMLCTVPYAVRKRWKRLSTVGTLRGWLEVHIFFGVVGPVLVTFHTAFKFNGLISVAYWLMVLVWSSGFVGRYLYVRIPKTIRGADVSRGDVEARLAAVSERLSTLPPRLAEELARLDARLRPRGGAPGVFDLFFGELWARGRLVMASRTLAGEQAAAAHAMVALMAERAALSRRLVHLERAKHVFELWHLVHRPLVFGLFVIVVVHVGVASFFGYARFAE